ncbi:hypothetical protein EK904_003840 [Melospiza melodia maxima]|nr:hypothetical protein EK904_003840 [Melospiza melodia maxima]
MQSNRLNQAGQFVPEGKGQMHGNTAVRAVLAVAEEEEALTQSLEEGLEVLLSTLSMVIVTIEPFTSILYLSLNSMTFSFLNQCNQD